MKVSVYVIINERTGREVFRYRAEEPLPNHMLHANYTTKLHTKPGKRSGRAGPNYDGTQNSITAARLYEPKRASTRWALLKLLLDPPRAWWTRQELSDAIGGQEVTRRVRELRQNYGWPVELEREDGVWWYRINVRPKR